MRQRDCRVAKPASVSSPAQEDQAAATPEDEVAGGTAPASGTTRREWLDERIREEYQEVAEEPLPPRLLALLRRLRPTTH
ncbi:NepR family anti-sigma factor [Teichococcus rhizosphaerae]|uniref:NepR family anti-sigma factor n=1 Tax=Teichococcus rhizosphaerae TaxID=1335062 RepID=UPI0011454C30|nr:NepR family anti-sigma factor [Pseudoroseomonas rhizosphaerae]